MLFEPRPREPCGVTRDAKGQEKCKAWRERTCRKRLPVMGGYSKPGATRRTGFGGWKAEIVAWGEGWGVPQACLTQEPSWRGPGATPRAITNHCDGHHGLSAKRVLGFAVTVTSQ